MVGINESTTQIARPRQKERNGLIDLYRFLLALVVVKSHSLFAVGGEYFGPGRVCVEFFFVLSGFLFFSFLEKSKDQPIKESLLKLFKSRVVPLAIPLVIGVASNIVSAFFDGEALSVWGYLWYVHVMIGEMAILVILRRVIKSGKKFTLALVCILLVALVLKFSGLCYSWGHIRGASSIPMGILVAMLPKWSPKHRWVIWIPLIPIFACCFAIVCFNLGNTEWFGLRIPELILDNVLYPALIYLSFCLEFKCGFFTYLGALSFGLYAFQCPADLTRTLGVSSQPILFGIILAATIIEDGGKRICKYIRIRSKNGTN